MKNYLVKCSNFYATYSAGKYQAESEQEAIEKARREYADSSLGRMLKDVGAFSFWVASDANELNDEY